MNLQPYVLDPDAPEMPHSLRGEWRRSAAIFLVALLVFAAFPSRNRNYADDSESWAMRIAMDHGFISVHHLYFQFMRGVHHALAGLLGPAEDPARLLSLYSALLGATGLVFFDALLRLVGLRRFALVATLACAFTAGYWTYAIVGDVYVPATAWMIVGVYAVCRGLAPGGRLVRDGGLATLAFLLMSLHHQAYAVFVVGLVPGVLVRRDRSLASFAYAVAIVAATGLSVLAVYFGFWMHFHYGETFAKFVTGYAGRNTWRPDQMRLTPGSLVNAVIGAGRALVPTQVLFRSETLTRLAQARFPYRNLYPYPFLVRHMSLASAGLIAASLAAIVLVGVPLGLRGLWHGLRQREALATLFVAAFFQALFFTWWEAVSDEFWIWCLPVVVVAIAAGAAASRARGVALAGLVAAALFASTLLGAVLPFADARNDIDQVNAWYVPQLARGDLLVGLDEIQTESVVGLARMHQGFEYFDLRLLAERWTDTDMDSLDRVLASATSRGARVFVGPYLVAPPRSLMACVRLQNPAFDAHRAAILARIGALDAKQLTWIPPAATVAGYFVAPAPAPPGARTLVAPPRRPSGSPSSRRPARGVSA